jgi:uncharacterized protein (DUF58 family)
MHGHGIEFAGYRQYTSGDDASLIDWKASVRSRKLLIKQLQEERDLNVAILLDVSDTMLTGTVSKVKAEYAAEIASTIAYATLSAGENVSFTMLADGIRKHLPFGHGVGHHALLLKLLVNPEYWGGVRNFPLSARQSLAMVTTPSLFILISDYIGFETSWERFLKIMATQHDLIVIIVRDPRDRRLPSVGEFLVEDPSTGQTLLIDATDYAAPYAAYVAQEEERIASLMRQAGAQMILLETTDDYADVLLREFILRKRRWWLD